MSSQIRNVTFSAVAVAAAAAHRSAARSLAVAARYSTSNTGFSGREKAQEDKYIRAHDKEVSINQGEERSKMKKERRSRAKE